ncbi:MAG: sterol desaturase family protein [Chitinophagales bacterium]|nr:sterol desaturase family protein [Chitinophagales bacterium]
MLNLITLSIPAFFILIAVELLINKMKKTNLYRLNDTISNLSSGIISQVVGVFTKIVTIGVYVWIYNNFRVFKNIPNEWYTWILLFIGVDFFYYWFHRLSHEVSVLWGTHVVHHQSEEYNLSVALRQSATQTFGSFWFYLPLAFIGFSPTLFATIAAIQTLYQFWIHTRLIDKMPAWFEYVFNTPSHHRVHHGVNPKYIDKNHGGTLIIFDRMFSTFQQEEEEVHYGVTSQLKSWNIAVANFDYYGWILQQLSKVKNAKDFFLVLLRKPGWRPAYLGGAIVPKEIDTQRQLYDAQSNRNVHIYIVFQFALLLAFASFFLFGVGDAEHPKFNTLQKYIATFFIIFSVINIGGLFENKNWSKPAEIIRLLCIPIVLYFLLH